MSIEKFFATIRSYAPLSLEAETNWKPLLRTRIYRKDETFIKAGETPTRFAFVMEGLLYQHSVGSGGDMAIKHFFSESSIVASLSASLQREPSQFTITAIENSSVIECDFIAFRTLVDRFPDIAAFYIRYLERHWIIEREPEEIAFRHDDLMQRYLAFIRKEPGLQQRLKQYHVAAWLGVAPESLSRLRKNISISNLASPECPAASPCPTNS